MIIIVRPIFQVGLIFFEVRKKAIIRLLFFVATAVWLVMVFSDLTVLFSNLKGLDPGVPKWLPSFLLSSYVVLLYYYYKFKIEHEESLNFTDLLWKVFATGLVATVISLAIRLLLFLTGATALSSNILFNYLNYQINFSLFLSFLIAALTSWKRLILYQKSKWLIRTWILLEFMLLLVLVSDNLPIDWGKPGGFSPLLIRDIVLAILVLVLSSNMKWVAYLNFKQKLTSLLLLALTIFYLSYFFFTVTTQSDTIATKSVAFLDFRTHVFNIGLLGFVGIYSIFSFLVILFNLPTSSVFEQKLEEVVNFQRISQSIQTEQSEESVYKILLESSVSTVFADAAWLEIKSERDEWRLFTFQISEKEANAIRLYLKEKNVTGIFDQGSDRTRNLSKHLRAIRGVRFRSLVSFPITVKETNIGTLALLKELPDGFNKEMTNIVSAFANQAGISIENFRLLEEALQNERYKEELKIAKTVQKSLLPQRLETDPDYEIAAFSESADEVGGDYYDTLRINSDEVALIIADVSGKGTTAAFHMSQMKGIFHSLAQQESNPREFMSRANQALVFCLERGSFISATYFVINSRRKTILYSRAGHCPVLYYQASTGQLTYLKDKGTALGMVKSRDYGRMTESNELTYGTGDIMVLYTDGITEAKNPQNDEFGYERLQETIREVVHKTPREIQEHLIMSLYAFSGSEDINDDYTTMIVKFNQ